VFAQQHSAGSLHVRSRLRAALVAGLVLGAAGSAQAEEPVPPPEPAAAPASPKNYVTVLGGTTLFYVANDGTSSGWQRDLSVGAGYGRLVTPTIAVELDVVPTFIKGEYDNTVLVPGVVWSFSTKVYAAARFLVKIDPEFNFTVFPGIGVVHAFSNGFALSLELNAGSAIGKGEPDFAVALTPGVLYSF
jgi:hypothetical protein